MRKSVLVAAMVLVLAGCGRDVQSIDEPAPTATTVARVGLAEPSILNRHGDGYGETRAHSIVEPTPTAKSQADASRNLSLGESDNAVQETKTAEPVRAAQADESRNLSLGGSDEAVQETKTVEPLRASQADESRNLSLGGSDNAVQETKTPSRSARPTPCGRRCRGVRRPRRQRASTGRNSPGVRRVPRCPGGAG